MPGLLLHVPGCFVRLWSRPSRSAVESSGNRKKQAPDRQRSQGEGPEIIEQELGNARTLPTARRPEKQREQRQAGDADDGHPTKEQSVSIVHDLLPQVQAVMHW